MKKILVAFMVLLASAFMIISCGNNDANDENADVQTSVPEIEDADAVPVTEENNEEQKAKADEEIHSELSAQEIVAQYVEENSDLGDETLRVEARGTSVVMIYTCSEEDFDFEQYGDEAIEFMKAYFDEIMTQDAVNGIYEGIKSECPEVTSLIIEYFTPDGTIIASYESNDNGTDESVSIFDEEPESDNEEYEANESDEAEKAVKKYVEENTTQDETMRVEARGTSIAVIYTLSEDEFDFDEYSDEIVKMYFDQIMTNDVLNSLYEGLAAECPEATSVIIEYYTPEGALVASYESGGADDVSSEFYDDIDMSDEEQIQFLVDYMNDSNIYDSLGEGITGEIQAEGTAIRIIFTVSDEILEATTVEQLETVANSLSEEVSLAELQESFPVLSAVYIDICDESGVVVVETSLA